MVMVDAHVIILLVLNGFIIVLYHTHNQMIDQWDLDSVLQRLKDGGVSLSRHVSAEPAKKDTSKGLHFFFLSFTS